MRTPFTFRKTRARYGTAILLALAWTSVAKGQASSAASAPMVLDRVVAVVNNRAILASDIANEMRLSVLDPNTASEAAPTPVEVLHRLISRSIIQQQMREEDTQALEPTEKAVQDRMAELRKELPNCVRQNCASDAGWAAFLAKNGLTQTQVENYLRLRLEMLGFIGNRFRQGIRIPEEEIENYYQKTLLPQYPKGEKVPPLNAVAPRIEEILLQQQVNVLFSAWLDNLRKQGDVEVLDPTLDPSTGPGTGTGGGDK